MLPRERQDIFRLILGEEVGVFVLPEAEEAVEVKFILPLTHVELRRTDLLLMNNVIEEEKRNSLHHFLPELVFEISSSC